MLLRILTSIQLNMPWPDLTVHILLVISSVPRPRNICSREKLIMRFNINTASEEEEEEDYIMLTKINRENSTDLQTCMVEEGGRKAQVTELF